MAVDMPDDLEALVALARDGDRESLERLVDCIQRPVYNLALRTLWHPEDAQDATQEILIRVITHLGSFRGDSRFMTWVFRVAANHLITARQSRVEAQAYTFDRFSANCTTVSPRLETKASGLQIRRCCSKKSRWAACTDF